MKKVKWKSKALTVLAVLAFLMIGGTPVKVHAQETNTTAKEEFLSLTNKKQEENVPFQVENLFPGDTVTRYYRVKADFKDAADVSFQVVIRDGYDKLAEVLWFKVQNADTDEVLYEGLIDKMAQPVQSTLTAEGKSSQELCYKITVSLGTDVGNEFQKQRLLADFQWWMTQETEPEATTKPDHVDSDDVSREDSDEEDSKSVAAADTGDSSNVFVWLALTIIGLFTLCLGTPIFLKKNKGKTNDRSKFITGLFCMVVLLTGLTVTTVAMMTYRVRVEENVFVSGEVDISFMDSDGNKIKEEDPTAVIIGGDGLLFEPGMTIVRKFMLKNEGTCDVYYKLYFDEIEGALADVLVVSVYEDEQCIYQGYLSKLTKDAVKPAEDTLHMGEEISMEIWFSLPTDCGNNVQKKDVVFNICADAVQTINNPDKLFH